MYFTRLTETEYEQFTKENFSYYTQSSSHFHYRNVNHQDVHIVGVKNNENQVIAACLLSEARCLKFFKYFYTHRGPVLNYSHLTLVKFFFKALTKYLKKQHCIYVLVDPYILVSLRESDGEIIESYDQQHLIQALAKLGYRHQGYTLGYSKMSQIRWLSVLDLKGKSETQLLNEMDYQTRRNIKKTYEMGVCVRTLAIDETETFFELFKMAEEKHGFKFRELEYFKEMQKIYGRRAFLKLAYIDLYTHLSKLKEKHHELESERNNLQAKLGESPNSKKTKSKCNQLKQQVDSNNRKIEETKDFIHLEGDTLNLASALFLYNEHEVYYLSSGSNPNYYQFMGTYRLQWEMIKFAKKHQINRYNFYGITGDFTEDAEDYGVQKFKEGFNAHVEEYIGDFIKPVNPVLYKIYVWIEYLCHR